MHDRIYYDDGSVYERRRVQAVDQRQPDDAAFDAPDRWEWVEVDPLPRTARGTAATPALVTPAAASAPDTPDRLRHGGRKYAVVIRHDLLVWCDASRAAWRVARGSQRLDAYHEYAAACRALYEYDHPTTEASDDEC